MTYAIFKNKTCISFCSGNPGPEKSILRAPNVYICTLFALIYTLGASLKFRTIKKRTEEKQKNIITLKFINRHVPRTRG